MNMYRYQELDFKNKQCFICGYIAKWNHKYCNMCGYRLKQ